MKIKAKLLSNYDNPKNWCFSILPTIGVSWENYGYQKVFMIYFVFLNFDFYIQFEKR